MTPDHKEAVERAPEIVAAAKLAAEHFDGRGGFANDGHRNLYQCDHDAAHIIVTVDREPGVAPFTIQCPHCAAAGTPGAGFYRHPAMTSALYRVPQNLRPTHEWYRPDTLEGLSPAVADHVTRGGLLLREIERLDRAALTQDQGHE